MKILLPLCALLPATLQAAVVNIFSPSPATFAGTNYFVESDYYRITQEFRNEPAPHQYVQTVEYLGSWFYDSFGYQPHAEIGAQLLGATLISETTLFSPVTYQGRAIATHSYMDFGMFNVAYNRVDIMTGNYAFRFQGTDGWHYGWIEIQPGDVRYIDAIQGGQGTHPNFSSGVRGVYVEQAPNTPVQFGIPEPGAAATVAVSWSVFLLKRRRAS